MICARISAIEYFIPINTLSNTDLASEFPEWPVEKIFSKTGISSRPIVDAGTTASDLAVQAALNLFSNASLSAESIDYIIYCTQSPDYFLPATACVIQDRLSCSKAIGAVDINQGCSGYIYGLGLAKGLIETGQASNVLLLTGETYSRYINPADKSVRTLFGDAGSATWIKAHESSVINMDSFVYGTDGSGAESLIVKSGGSRFPYDKAAFEDFVDDSGNVRNSSQLYMDGPEVFAFTLREVPPLVNNILNKASLSAEDIDWFIPHQANKFMLDSMIRSLPLFNKKMIRAYEKFGNTVSATIPIAIKEGWVNNTILPGQRLLLAGFGVGLSWGGCIISDINLA